MNHILDKLHIHHCLDETMCEVCKKTKALTKLGVCTELEQKSFDKGIQHKQSAQHQMQQYLLNKCNIQNNTAHDKDILVLQDFTQLKVQGTFFQCFIFVIYSHKATATDNLDRHYYLFLGPNGKK